MENYLVKKNCASKLKKNNDNLFIYLYIYINGEK